MFSDRPLKKDCTPIAIPVMIALTPPTIAALFMDIPLVA
jgi:hypothetical protein